VLQIAVAAGRQNLRPLVWIGNDEVVRERMGREPAEDDERQSEDPGWGEATHWRDLASLDTLVGYA
jgi:hypothetical protein